jgi:chorismate mutase
MKTGRPAILLTLAVLVALFAAFPASAVRRKCPGYCDL